MNKELNNLPQSDFVKRVWNDLSTIDLDGYTKILKHAGNATYLSWSNAWTLLMQRYPWSSETYEVNVLENKSVEIRCTLTVSDGLDEFTRVMHLPVMDSKNQAIFDPSSRAISDTKARCLVKCLSKFGLGIHLYNGDEFPKLERADNILVGNISREDVTRLTELLTKTNSDVDAFLKFMKIEALDDLPKAKLKNADALLTAKLKKIEAAK